MYNRETRMSHHRESTLMNSHHTRHKVIGPVELITTLVKHEPRLIRATYRTCGSHAPGVPLPEGLGVPWSIRNYRYQFAALTMCKPVEANEAP